MAENPSDVDVDVDVDVDTQSSDIYIRSIYLEQSQKGLASTSRAPATDLENQEYLHLHLKTLNLRSEYDAVQAKAKANLDATRRRQTTELVEELKRIYNDKQNERFDFASQPEQSIETSDKEQIQCALDYYRDEIKGGDYEFVKCEIMVAASLLVAHTNFYARRKGTDSPELFFAVLENGSPQKATHCCKLDPRFYSIDGANSSEVIHCEHVKCTQCAKWADIAIGPEDNVFII